MSFYLTAPRMKHAYVQHHNVLSNFDIQEIFKYISTQNLQQGLLANGKVNDDIRRSKVLFLPIVTETKWLYNKIGQFLVESNQKHFGVDLTALQSIQYTEYHAENSGTYDDHLDFAPHTPLPRKLSVSIQLSDDTDYEGGDLQLKMSSQKPYCASRLKGDGLVFPSWILHGVTPVTKGVRKSLVVWAEGPEWR